MNRTDAPKKQPVPFAVNGQREALLPATPAGDNTASYNNGFPPVTMILKAAGGLPPKGQDMNQILFELSSLVRWLSAGAMNSFDATFSAGIGGYPKGSILLGDDGKTVYQSIIDSNTNNPNTSSTGWMNVTLKSGIQNKVVFSNVGVTNWTVPDDLKNGRKCKVTVIGSGGSGGRSAGGGGGGGGGKAVKVLDLSGETSIPVTVGAGGPGLSSGTTQISGNGGQSSSFGTHLSATGGGAGGVVSGGVSGVGSGGDENTGLGPGTPGMSWGSFYCGGSGGGPGGAGSSNDTSRNGANAVGPGGGSAGAAWGATVADASTGAGYNGIVIVEW